MRKPVMVGGCLLVAACGGGQPKVDAAVASDTMIVSGPPAVPTSGVPAADSSRPLAPAADVPRRVITPPRSTSPAGPAASEDSVRGIVSITGTSFDRHVMIASAGNRRVEISGALARLIGQVSGAEVIVRGRMDGRNFDASSFVVRSVDGQPAIDGTLKTESGALYIVEASGTRTRIIAPPPPLQGQDGARVWVTGDLAKGVSAFGFIDPPR